MKDTFWKEKLFRYIDRYNRAFNTGDFVAHKEAENDIVNLIENISVDVYKEGYDFGKYKCKEIVDKFNFDGQYDVIIKEIENLSN